MKKEKKKFNLKILIIIIILIIVASIIWFIKTNIYETSEAEENAIVATKIEEYNGKNKTTTYKIQIKDFEISNITKEIEYPSKQEAKIEYETYEQIDLYEKKGVDVELKGKKLVFKIPKERYQDEIGYSEEDKELLILDNNELKEIIGKDAVINALIKREFTIK